MGKSSPPPPPDPKKTAGAQTATNIGTAIANTNLQQVNQDTPWGSQTYTRRPNEDYDPENPTPPEIREVQGDGIFPGAPGRTSYQVGDEAFNSREEAERYRSNLSPDDYGTQYETYTYVDPNTGAVHEIPLYDVQTTLPEDQQAALDAQFRTNKIMSRTARDQTRFLRDYLGQGINTDDLAGPVGSDQVGDLNLRDSYRKNFSKDRRRVENALMKRLNRQFGKDEDALQQRLANQGIAIGSDAYQGEYDQFGRERADARLGAILAGGQEQSRMAGLARDQAAFTNQARQSTYNSRMANANLDNSLRNQQLNERFALRNQPINEISALLSGSQVQNPGFQVQTPAGIPTTDYAGIVSDNYNQHLGAWEMENANRQSLMGGLLGFGGNVVKAMPASMWSDRRLKRDVRRVGEIDGLNVYEYEYVWGGGRRRGYMADEVQEIHPEAVVQVDGFLALDYAKLPEVPA